MNLQQVISWILDPENKKKEFEIRFIKRSDETERVMRCQYGVNSELSRNPTRSGPDAKMNGLLTVWDLDKLGYRSIPIEGVREIKLPDCEWEIVI